MMDTAEGRLFSSLEEVYQSVQAADDRQHQARTLLGLRDWYVRICEFDPLTGLPLPVGFSRLAGNISAVAESADETLPNDRVARILDHCEEALGAIMERPRDTISRGHAMMPVHRASELDSSCVQWLSRLPGRTIREKLAGRSSLMAVDRRMTIDTAENRLLKAFLLRLEQLLKARLDAFSGPCRASEPALLSSVQYWLRDDEPGAEIGDWSNLPPNNTLLQDRNYRKIWDGWLGLLNLDQNTREDHARLSADVLKALFWNILACLDTFPKIRFVEHPCFFDYDHFEITQGMPIQGALICGGECSAATGKVFKLGPDQNGKLHGYLMKPSKETVAFHADDFVDPAQVRGIHQGTLLSFTERSTDWGPVAFRIRIVDSEAGSGGEVGPTIPIRVKADDGGVIFGLGERSVAITLKSGRKVDLAYFHHEKKRQVQEHSCDGGALYPLARKVSEFLVKESVPSLGMGRSAGTVVSDSEVTLDLCATRPHYCGLSGDEKLPVRLLRQYWGSCAAGQEPVAVECGSSKAIDINDGRVSVSILTLFSGSEGLTPATVVDATKSFLQNVACFLQPESLTYLVPDAVDEFSLEGIRRGVNFHFPGALPLPRSIASVFVWQGSQSFSRAGIADGDVVLVADNGPGGASITPLVAFRDEALSKALPESKGIYWERHPSLPMANLSPIALARQALERDGCLQSEKIAELMGFEGLLDDSGEISFVAESGAWYNLSTEICTLLAELGRRNAIRSKDVDAALACIPGIESSAKVFLLCATLSLGEPEKMGQVTWVRQPGSLTAGGQLLSQWQKRAGEISLWRDHLPELSIEVSVDGRWDRFFLVKDAMVVPRKGRRVEIPVREQFTLSAGKKEYFFPLQQGSGGRKLKYKVYLKCAAFPLKRDTVCHLKMTYTYGADDPYELVFVPVASEDTEFRSVRAEWRELQPSDEGEPIFPHFPKCPEWAEYMSFPRKDGRPSNLLNWLGLWLGDVDCIVQFGRCTSTINSAWKVDQRTNCRYCFTSDNVRLYEDAFDEKPRQLPSYGEAVSFYKIVNGTWAKGKDITVGEAQPQRCFLKKGRFPARVIWSHSRSLSDPGMPSDFRDLVRNGVDNCLSILRNASLPEVLKNEIIYFLCCLHRDSPEGLVRQLATRLAKSPTDLSFWRKNCVSVANAIGDGDLDWQKDLVDGVMGAIENKNHEISSMGLMIMGIALWRSERLLHTLSYETVSVIAANLLSDIQRIDSSFARPERGRKLVIRFEMVKFELLLALLRTREGQDKRLSSLLAPGKKLTTAFVEVVDKVAHTIYEENLVSDITTRINLQLDKPKAFHKTPDLLYALRMYLTGDSGANAIHVSGVSDDD